MNKENKKLWIEALRSGKFEQGIGALCKNNKYCCLGVLVKVFEEQNKLKFDSQVNSIGYFFFGGETTTPPKVVLDWVRITKEQLNLVMALNDNHECTFKSIANVLTYMD